MAVSYNFPGYWATYSSPPENINFDVAFSVMMDRIKAATLIAESVDETLNRTCECNPSLKARILSEILKLVEMNSELAEFLYQKTVEELKNGSR